MLSAAEQESRKSPVIGLDRVSKRYGRNPEIFSDVSLSLEKQSFTFLTGASGAGKSTLLKLLYLALNPTRGLITIFGQDVQGMSRQDRQLLKRKIGVVSQDFALIPHLNVFENATLPLRAAGYAPSKYKEDASELLRWVGLGDHMHAKPPTLSGGEAQRVAIARAVMSKPEILIADEPTGNVDPEMGQKLLRLFLEMNRTGTTVIIATHDISLVSGIKANQIQIVDGKLSTGSAL